MSSPTDQILEKLTGVRPRGNSWVARCPAHEDRDPSLSISTGDDGRVLLRCFAGCSSDLIVAAISMTMSDLFPRRPRTRSVRRRRSTSTSASTAPTTPMPAAGLTVAELADAKKLPAATLVARGVHDTKRNGVPAVAIPYHGRDGAQLSVRYRHSLTGGRFSWRSGDHVHRYGLERLAAIQEAGWVLLVEGESDVWTADARELPALGIPGKTTWRPEWAYDLEGLEVCLWQEPDAEDLTALVARDLPDMCVIVAPAGTKDISEAHVRGDDVVALLDGLRREARSARELLAERAEHELRVDHGKAAPILGHPDPLVLIREEIRAQGYGGDMRAPMLAALAMTSRVLAPRRGSLLAHTLFKGASSSGKNAAMQAGLRLLPEEAFRVIDAGSPRVLIYDDAPLEHRVIVFSESDSLPAGEDNPAASAIRNLLQDGYLHYQVTVRDPESGGFVVRTIKKPGPSVLVTTSTRSLGTQMMTRLFTVEIPDEPGHLRAALAAQAAMELGDVPLTSEALLAFQRYLQALAPIDVVVPFAAELSVELGRRPIGPRVLRDYPRLLSLIKAVTVVRIAWRSRDDRGRLIATLDDYDTVYDLVADTYQASAGASERVREAVVAVAQLTSLKGSMATVNISEVSGHLGISVPSASRRIRDAVAGGWLVNDESRKSQPAKLRVGEALPSASLLPPRSDLVAAMSQARDVETDSENSASGIDPTSVSTFSPDTGAYKGDIATGGEADAGYPTVEPENAQTASTSANQDTRSDPRLADETSDIEAPGIDLVAEAYRFFGDMIEGGVA